MHVSSIILLLRSAAVAVLLCAPAASAFVCESASGDESACNAARPDCYYSSGTCSAVECTTYEEAFCGQLNGLCSWDAAQAACITTGCSWQNPDVCGSPCSFDGGTRRCSDCASVGPLDCASTSDAFCSLNDANSCAATECSAYSQASCLSYGCFWTGASCTNPLCAEGTDATCTSSSRCTWHPSLNVCTGRCDPDHCDETHSDFDRLNCFAATHGICARTCSLLTSAAACAEAGRGACTWAGNSCARRVACSTADTSAACTGLSDPCVWDASYAVCKVACDMITDTNACSFYDGCMPGPDGACTALNCTVATNDTGCLYLEGCLWSGSECVRNCTSVASAGDCTSPCFWDSTQCGYSCSDLGSACSVAPNCLLEDGSCTEKYSWCDGMASSECWSQGCHWANTSCLDACSSSASQTACDAIEYCSYSTYDAACKTGCSYITLEDECTGNQCVWAEATGVCSAPVKECTARYVQAECEEDAKCDWWPGLSGFCNVRCDGASTESQCMDLEICRWKDDACEIQCENAYEETFCELLFFRTCYWSADATCEEWTDFACDAFSDQTSCIARDECKWTGGACIPYCTKIHDDYICESQTACTWDFDECLFACDELGTQLCNIGSTCMVDSQQCKTRCPNINTAEACASDASCAFVDVGCLYNCEAASQSTCVTAANCFYVSAQQRCSDRNAVFCEGLTLKTDCSNFGCAWSAADKTCEASAPACDTLTSSATCSTQDICLWTGASCVKTCTKREKQSECAKDGYCLWKTNTCIAYEDDVCFNAFVESECPASENCVWTKFDGCVDASEVKQPVLCGELGPIACLDTVVCELVQQGQACVDRSFTFVNRSTACTNQTTEATCLEVDCTWVIANTGGFCEESEAPPCDTLFTEELCHDTPGANCTFYDGHCFDSCSEIEGTTDCIRSGCVFSSYERPRCSKENGGSCASMQTKDECNLATSRPPCIFDADTRFCRESVLTECQYNAEVQQCLDHDGDCGWSDFNEVCVPCHTEDESTCANLLSCEWDADKCVKEGGGNPRIFSTTVSVWSPSPHVPFSVTFSGTVLSVDDGVAFVVETQACPARRSLYKIRLVGSTGDGYVTDAVILGTVGTFKPCYFSAKLGIPIRTDNLPTFDVAFYYASSLDLSVELPMAGEPFDFIVVGQNLKMQDMFAFVPHPATACPDSLGAYTPFAVVDEFTAEGKGLVDLGTWVLCYASTALVERGKVSPELTTFLVAGDPVLVVSRVEHLNTTQLEWTTEIVSDDLGFDFAKVNSKSCSVDGARGLRLATYEVPGYHWGPLTAFTKATSSIQFGSVRERRHLHGQVCVTPMVLDEWFDQASNAHLALNFVSFAIDPTDVVRIFAKDTFSGVDGVIGATSVAPDEYSRGDLPDCPESLDGLTLMAAYSGVQRPEAPFRVKFETDPDYPEWGSVSVVVAVCTDARDFGGTGFQLEMKIVAACPNDCLDATGVVRGVCNVDDGQITGVCECSDGWTGDDCSQREVCYGYRDAVSPRTKPVGSVDAQVPAGNICGFALAPDPEEDASLVRFGMYEMVLEVSSETTLRGSCSQNYVTVYAGNWRGILIRKLCPEDLGVRDHVFLIHSGIAHVEVAGAAVGRIRFRYKAVSLECPALPGDKPCSGLGTCYDREAGPAFDDYPLYLKACTCPPEYVAPTVLDTCSVCSYGYAKNNESECIKSLGCTSLDDCGGAERAVECTTDGCVCKDGWHGQFCGVSVPAPVSDVIDSAEHGSHLVLRLAFGDSAMSLANVAPATAGVPDHSVSSCQVNRDLPCLASDRKRGNIYTATGRVLGDEADASSTGVFLNKESASMGFHPDQITLIRVRSTPLDVSGSLTVTAWVQVSRATTGFLVAKTDHVMHKTGDNPMLDTAAEEIRAFSILHPDAKVHVYFALYLDGADGAVYYYSSKPKNDEAKSVDDNRFIKKFRIGGDLFDSKWHFLAMTVARKGGRWEASIFVDGRTSTSDASYVQCLPFPPDSVQSGKPPVTEWRADKGEPNVWAGGVLTVGYNFTGSVDEVRVYDDQMQHYNIVDLGSMALFESTLSLPAAILIAMGVATIIPLSLALLFPLARVLLKKYRARSAVAVMSVETVIVSRTGSAATGLGRPAEPRGQTPPAKEEDPGAVGKGVKEEDAAGGKDGRFVAMKRKIAAFGHAAALGVGSGVGGTAGGVGAERVQDAAQAFAGDGDGGAGFAGPAASPAGFAQTAGEGVRDAVELQLAIIRDSWQMLALFLTAWDWPPLFKSIFGYATLPFSIDLTLISSSVQESMQNLSPFEWAFYAGLIVCVASYFILACIIFSTKVEPVDFMLQQRAKYREIIAGYEKLLSDLKAEGAGRARIRMAHKAKEQMLEEAGMRKKWKDRAAFATLFTLSTLYLPITRGAIMILRCHREVQCIWDCASLQDAPGDYLVAFGIAMAAGALIGVSAPVFLWYVVRRKRRDFESMHPDVATRGENWTVFAKEDRTSYKHVYAGFEYRWAYFQSWLMLFKALMCIPTLGLEENGESQLIAAVVIQAGFTLLMFATSPFILDACDNIIQVGQVNIMFCLAISCFYRADPTRTEYEHILIAAGIATILVQLGNVIFNNSGTHTMAPIDRLVARNADEQELQSISRTSRSDDDLRPFVEHRDHRRYSISTPRHP